jgi:hypothetical protein
MCVVACGARKSRSAFRPALCGFSKAHSFGRKDECSFVSPQITILGIVVSILAYHAGDPGSILGRVAFFPCGSPGNVGLYYV